jgi:hypothetical protein
LTQVSDGAIVEGMDKILDPQLLYKRILKTTDNADMPTWSSVVIQTVVAIAQQNGIKKEDFISSVAWTWDHVLTTLAKLKSN